MFRTLADFQKVWRYESESTVKIFRLLNDAALQQPVSPGGRTLGYLAWHLVLTLPELMGHARIPVDGPPEHAPAPTTVEELIAAYQSASQSLLKQLPEYWRDSELTDKIPMYGQQWAKGAALLSLVLHQAHHRGQMTIVLRQLGLGAAGIYGPAKHEWESMGLPSMP